MHILKDQPHAENLPEEMDLVGRSPAIQRLVQEALKAAKSGDWPILITGPVGAGKSHLARFVHRRSFRSAGPLVFVDCGALPGDLDNTLFGHRAGSFTGAVRDFSGRLEQAGGGSLVLDDFDRLSLHHQDQLHRVLENGRFYPVGSRQETRVDVRFIATTNKDPRREVEAGRLKEDFVSRLSYLELHVPPLHHRPEDVPPLCEELLRRHLAVLRAKGYREEPLSFDEDCWPALQARAFDDNVRGLDKLVARLIVHVGARTTIEPEDVEAVAPAVRPSGGAWFDQPAPLRKVRDEAEKRYILDVCRFTEFNLRRSARILGISPKSLYAKLRQYGIVRPH